MPRRRHNTIVYGPDRAEDRVLNGLLADPDSPDLARAINGNAPRCACGYTLDHCGCPGSPRLHGRAVVDVPLPEPEVRGCPRCRPGGCPPCGYQPANCACPGGPRAAALDALTRRPR